MNHRGDPDDVFNFGFHDNSLEDIPANDFQSNPSEFSLINQVPQRRKSLINFSALGNESGNNMSYNQGNDVSNNNDKLRLIPSRILSNMGAIQSENNDHSHINPSRSSPPNHNFGLPPLSTLLGFSDQNPNNSQSPPQSPPSQTNQKLNNQRFFTDDYSDKTSVTISDSSSGKAIPPTIKQAKNGIHKQQPKKTKQNQYQDEDLSEDQQTDDQINSQKQRSPSPPPPPPPELKMDLNSAFDSAIDNFNHYFFNEFKSLLRPCTLPITTPEIDNFTFSLADEITKSILLPPQTEKNQAVIARTNNTIDLLIKEEMSQIIESMKQKSIRMKSREEKDFDDLKRLLSEIKELTSEYDKISKHALKNLNHERLELGRINETDKINQKTFLDSKRKLSLKLLELESIQSRQNNEVLQLQRNENNLYYSREELHERLLSSYDMKYNKLRAKILSEIDGLTEYIEDPIFETISSKADEIKSVIRMGDVSKDNDEELNNNKNQVPQVFFMPQHYHLNNKLINNNRNENDEKNSEDSSDSKEISNLKSIAMRKLDEIRKQREDALKGIYPKKKIKKKD